MFPFQQGEELSFQIPDHFENAIISSGNHNINFDTTINAANIFENAGGTAEVAQCGEVVKSTAKRGRPRRSTSTMEVNNNNKESQGGGISGNDVANKRIIHREIERQRRQEMAQLYSSLRSLLPLEYIRGKRSISDHITEAAKYIKDLEKNVNELRQNRDKLKASPSSSFSSANNLRREDVGYSSATASSSSPSSSTSDYNVSVHASGGAIEIEISAGVVVDEAFPLSSVFGVLVKEGLTIVDCVSSKVNQRWIHVIHCEAIDEISIYSGKLERRLLSDIGSSYDS